MKRVFFALIITSLFYVNAITKVKKKAPIKRQAKPCNYYQFKSSSNKKIYYIKECDLK